MCMLEIDVFLHSIKPCPPAVSEVPDPMLQYKSVFFVFVVTVQLVLRPFMISDQSETVKMIQNKGVALQVSSHIIFWDILHAPIHISCIFF